MNCEILDNLLFLLSFMIEIRYCIFFYGMKVEKFYHLYINTGPGSVRLGHGHKKLTGSILGAKNCTCAGL